MSDDALPYKPHDERHDEMHDGTPNALDATALRDAIARGERSVEETVLESLAATEAQIDLGAFLAVLRDDALDRARALDAALARGKEAGPLCGVPIAIKANLCFEGTEVNCGSRILAGYRPPYTATVVTRLLDAGCVPIGTTNMDEFAMGSSGENSAFGLTRNPWSRERTPGGSSSGSAAAVAAGLVPLALGSDTGGSVRQPAALCGITGFKPTYGRVSRYGLVAFGSSLDQVSPLARSVRDIELCMAVISGGDRADSTCFELGPVELEPEDSVRGLRIGVPSEFFGDGLDDDVRARTHEAIDALVALGAERVEVSLPHMRHAIATYYVIANAEASSNLARYDGVRYGLRKDGDGSLPGMYAATRDAGFGDEVKRRILLGTYVLSSGYYEAWYGRAQRVRTLIHADFKRAFKSCDLIAGPTSPTPAFKLGERTGDPVAMYLSDILTVPLNLAGLPGVSVPCGFAGSTHEPLPVGLQLIGPSLADARVLRAARVYQAATRHHVALPPTFTTESPA